MVNGGDEESRNYVHPHPRQSTFTYVDQRLTEYAIRFRSLEYPTIRVSG